MDQIIFYIYLAGQPKPQPKSFPTTIRRLALLYCSICDVLRQVNDSHGTVLVALLLCLLLHLVITPYHVITNICWLNALCVPSLCLCATSTLSRKCIAMMQIRQKFKRFGRDCANSIEDWDVEEERDRILLWVTINVILWIFHSLE